MGHFTVGLRVIFNLYALTVKALRGLSNLTIVKPLINHMCRQASKD